MQGKSISYFVRGNTSKGEVSFFDSNFDELASVIRVTGYPHRTVAGMLQTIGEAALEQGEDVQFIRGALDNTIEGVILPARQIGVYQDFIPKDAKQQGLWFNGLDVLRPEYINGLKTKLNASRAAYRQEMEQAYLYFAQGLQIHDVWEQLYIGQLDFDTINHLTLQLIHDFLGDKSLDKKAKNYDRFLGCATAGGAVDYIEDLTADVENRYFIKGRPGTGKSTLLKKLAQSAGEKGFDTEVYHCGFDPDSLDMLILRELGICIFDSTAPHEYFPSRETDQIIDVYQMAKKSDVDQKRVEELEAVQEAYRGCIRAATIYLNRAQNVVNAIDEALGGVISQEDIDALFDRLEEAIQKD